MFAGGLSRFGLWLQLWAPVDVGNTFRNVHCSKIGGTEYGVGSPNPSQGLEKTLSVALNSAILDTLSLSVQSTVNVKEVAFEDFPRITTAYFNCRKLK